jgi:DNA repair exonuclease SbcCD ATPase subunit
MTDYNDDYYEPEDDEPSEQEEMLFALIKQAKEQQERTNAVLERLISLADKLEQGEQARNDKLDNALDKLADIDLQGIVSETTKQAVNELVVNELKQGVSQYVASQNAKIEQNAQALLHANNIVTRNINSFADLIAKLKADETDLLERQLAERVQLAVQQGVGNGLDRANNDINNFLIAIGDELEQGERNVKQLNANIKRGAGQAVAELDEYREQIASRPRWLMALGWCVFYTFAITIIAVVTYRMNIPLQSEIKERSQIIQNQDFRITQQQQQLNYMNQALRTNFSAWEDGNLYLRVDRNKCRDINNQNYCMKQ